MSHGIIGDRRAWTGQTTVQARRSPIMLDSCRNALAINVLYTLRLWSTEMLYMLRSYHPTGIQGSITVSCLPLGVFFILRRDARAWFSNKASSSQSLLFANIFHEIIGRSRISGQLRTSQNATVSLSRSCWRRPLMAPWYCTSP